jgi:crossover junction endodeoxyribonuclease RuvC
MMIAAIDPSIRNTGMAWTTGKDPETMRFSSANDSARQVSRRIARYEEVIHRINKRLHELQPQVILIEGYSFGTMKHQAESLAEYGGILRWHLLEHTEHIYEVAPSTLKKFATGTGRGDKALIMAHVAMRWGRLFENSDEADAYVLARIGLAACGLDSQCTASQKECALKVVGDDGPLLCGMATAAAPAC